MRSLGRDLSSVGTIGGKIAHHPFWATVIAISFAVSIGVGVQQLQRLWQARKARQAAETLRTTLA